MSKRHQDLMPEKSPREVRKLEKRRLRHEIAQSLHTIGDPEAAVVGEPKADRVPLHETPPDPRRFRHWKVKDWKRRTNNRHRRNLVLQSLLRADD